MMLIVFLECDDTLIEQGCSFSRKHPSDDENVNRNGEECNMVTC